MGELIQACSASLFPESKGENINLRICGARHIFLMVYKTYFVVESKELILVLLIPSPSFLS